MKYCLPIIKNSKEEVLKQISENPEFDYYEIWLSYIQDLDTNFVWKISDQYNGKLIFLFRKQNLEKSDLNQEVKEKIIKVLETSENFLDLDINDQKEELDFIEENKLKNKTSLLLRSKLIVSYHNYEETPSFQKIVDEIKEFDPVIIKVSTFCQRAEDSLKLLNLLLELKKQGEKFIISGMGDDGKIVRIYGALWGNEMNFAPVDGNEKSAPGQLTKENLEKIFEILK